MPIQAVIHIRNLCCNKTTDISDNLINLLQDETSLKQVLKQAEYTKVEPIIDILEKNGKIAIQETTILTGKSRTTAWRYVKLLEKTGLIVSQGETNNLTYYLKSNIP